VLCVMRITRSHKNVIIIIIIIIIIIVVVGPTSFFTKAYRFDSVTMTTEVGTNGATTLSCMNFSGYFGH